MLKIEAGGRKAVWNLPNNTGNKRGFDCTTSKAGKTNECANGETVYCFNLLGFYLRVHDF